MVEALGKTDSFAKIIVFSVKENRIKIVTCVTTRKLIFNRTLTCVRFCSPSDVKKINSY